MRHTGGGIADDSKVDLQASVHRLNMSDANVSNVLAGLDQLKSTTTTKRGAGGGYGESSMGSFDPRSIVRQPVAT